MNTKKNMFWSILLIIAGSVLLGFGIPGKIDVFWCGFGGSLIGVAIMQLIGHWRYKNNPEFKKQYDIDRKDERNSYLRSKACEYALSAYVVLAGLACAVLAILDKYQIAYILAYTIGAAALLYFIGFTFAKRKY